MTTVVIQHLPESCSSEMLRDLLCRSGFQDSVDFVYVPMRFVRQAAMGYGFVNFVSPRAAGAFKGLFEGLDFGAATLAISWAEVQGLGPNIERYRNSPVMHPLVPQVYKPMLLQHGLEIPFPCPTQHIKAPKLKQRSR